MCRWIPLNRMPRRWGRRAGLIPSVCGIRETVVRGATRDAGSAPTATPTMSVSTASATPAWLVFVSRNGPIQQCDFCARTDTLGLQVGCLFHYMAGCLRAEWDDPNNAVAREGGRFGQDPHIIDSDDLLDELDHPLENEALQREFVGAFDRLWCQRDPCRLDYSEMLFLSWSQFSELAKTDKRYFWYRAAVPAGRRRRTPPARQRSPTQ